MERARRRFLATAAAVSAGSITGCVAPFGHSSSYTNQVLKPQNQNTVYYG